MIIKQGDLGGDEEYVYFITEGLAEVFLEKRDFLYFNQSSLNFFRNEHLEQDVSLIQQKLDEDSKDQDEQKEGGSDEESRKKIRQTLEKQISQNYIKSNIKSKLTDRVKNIGKGNENQKEGMWSNLFNNKKEDAKS